MREKKGTVCVWVAGVDWPVSAAAASALSRHRSRKLSRRVPASFQEKVAASSECASYELCVCEVSVLRRSKPGVAQEKEGCALDGANRWTSERS